MTDCCNIQDDVAESIGWLQGTQNWGWRCCPTAPVGRVLLAGPFGEERKCALRLMTHLGRVLARLGFECLRIDYTGTGDSGGSHSDATLTQWRAELNRAASILKQDESLPCFGLGVRLGGNLMLDVEGLDGICCWEPLPSGSHFVDELQRRRAIKSSAGGGGQSTNDFDGYSVSDVMLAELSKIDLGGQLQMQLDRKVLLLHVTGAREPLGPWADVAAAIHSPHGFQLVRERPFWGRVDDKPREELFRATTDFLLDGAGRSVAGTDN